MMDHSQHTRSLSRLSTSTTLRPNFNDVSFTLCALDEGKHAATQSSAFAQDSQLFQQGTTKPHLSIDVSGASFLPADEADMRVCPAPRHYSSVGATALPRHQSTLVVERHGPPSDGVQNKWDTFAQIYGTREHFLEDYQELDHAMEAASAPKVDPELEELGIKEDVDDADKVSVDKMLFRRFAAQHKVQWMCRLDGGVEHVDRSAATLFLYKRNRSKPNPTNWRYWHRLLHSRYCRASSTLLAHIERLYTGATQPPSLTVAVAERKRWKSSPTVEGFLKTWWSKLQRSKYEQNRSMENAANGTATTTDDHISIVALGAALLRVQDALLGWCVPRWYLLEFAWQDMMNTSSAATTTTTSSTLLQGAAELDVNAIVSFQTFINAVFDIADKWTETCFEEEWCLFLTSLGDAVFSSDITIDCQQMISFATFKAKGPTSNPYTTERWQWRLPKLPGCSNAVVQDTGDVDAEEGTSHLNGSHQEGGADAAEVWIEYPLDVCATLSRQYLQCEMEGCHSLSLPIFGAAASEEFQENIHFDDMVVTRGGVRFALRRMDAPTSINVAPSLGMSTSMGSPMLGADMSFHQNLQPEHSISAKTLSMIMAEDTEGSMSMSMTTERTHRMQKLQKRFPTKDVSNGCGNDPILGEMDKLLSSNYLPPPAADADMDTIRAIEAATPSSAQSVAQDATPPEHGQGAGRRTDWGEELDWGADAGPIPGEAPRNKAAAGAQAPHWTQQGEEFNLDSRVLPHPVPLRPGIFVPAASPASPQYDPNVDAIHGDHVVSGIVEEDVFDSFADPILRKEQNTHLSHMKRCGWRSTPEDITVKYHDGFCRFDCTMSLPSLLCTVGDQLPCRANAKVLFGHLAKNDEASGEEIDIRLYDTPLVNPNSAYLDQFAVKKDNRRSKSRQQATSSLSNISTAAQQGHDSTALVVTTPDGHALTTNEHGELVPVAEEVEEASNYTFDIFLSAEDQVDPRIRHAIIHNGALPLLRRVVRHIRDNVAPLQDPPVPPRFVARSGSHVTLLLVANDNAAPPPDYHSVSQKTPGVSNFSKPISFSANLMKQIHMSAKNSSGPRVGKVPKPLGGDRPRVRIPRSVRASEDITAHPGYNTEMHTHVPLNRQFAFNSIRSKIVKQRHVLQEFERTAMIQGEDRPPSPLRSQSAPLLTNQSGDLTPTRRSPSRMQQAQLPPSGFEDGSAHSLSPTKITTRQQRVPLPEAEDVFIEKAYKASRSRSPGSSSTKRLIGRLEEYSEKNHLRSVPAPKTGLKPALRSKPKDVTDLLKSYDGFQEGTVESLAEYDGDSFKLRPLELRNTSTIPKWGVK